LRKQAEASLEGTLAYVREAGFEAVELAGLYGRPATEFRKALDGSSLHCCGSHTPLPELTGDRFRATLGANQELGNRYLIVPGLPAELHAAPDRWARAARILNEVAEQLRPYGMRVGYHNHADEFRPVDGVFPWRVLFEQTRPDVILQLDTGNARVAGADPTALVREFPGRAVTVHVKDYLPNRLDPVLGSSDFDWSRFIQACETTGGTEWYVIEHDSPVREEVGVCFEALAKSLGRRPHR